MICIIRPKSLVIFAISTLFGVDIALSCPSNHYEQCIGPSFARVCTCLPTPAVIIEKENQFPDALNTITGAIKGDASLITKGVGGWVVKAAAPGVSTVSDTILSQDQKSFAEQVIGRGFILLVSGLPPEIVISDALGNIVDHFPASPPKANPMDALMPGAKKRDKKSFKPSQATCIVKATDGTVVAAWINEPSITNTNNNEVKNLVKSDLRPNDVLKVSSDNCPFENQGKGAQVALTEVTMTYDYTDTRIGPADGIHWMIVGKIVK